MLNWLRDIFTPPGRRLQRYLADPFTYEKQILRLGERAVPGLISILDEKRNGWGAALIDISPADIDEAMRGLASEHAIIRQHAVRVLGDRSLGGAAGKEILPRLAERLEDDQADVRRMALLSLANWKSAARPYHVAMRKRQHDDDHVVRVTATYVFE